MADDEPLTSQRRQTGAADDLFADESDTIMQEHTSSDDVNLTSTNKPAISDNLLQAARLSKLMQHQPRYGLHKPPCILAWSSTNLIAIGRSKRITLIHLLEPSRVAHLTTLGRASLLSFSPRGDALIASFPDFRHTTIWIRGNGTLNEWRIAGEWHSFEGRVLDAQWLSPGRKVLTESMRRAPCRGPQIDPMEHALSLLLVTDVGQVIMLCNDIVEGKTFRVSTTKLNLGRQMRLRQATIGLVADESLALLAYTKRQSTKVSHSVSDVDSRAIQMFFDDTDVLTQDEEEKDVVEDSRDCLHIAEIKVDLYRQGGEADVSVRPVLPIFVASYGDPYLPYVDKVTQLMWLDTASQQPPSDEGVKLRLFASFVDEGTTTLRTWMIQREDVTKVSSAFTNLNSSKSTKVVESEEDWVAVDGGTERYQQLQLGDFVVCDSSNRRLLCSSMELPQFDNLQEMPAIKISWSTLDTDTLSIVQTEGGVTTPRFRSQISKLAVSPHNTLAVGAVRGRLTLTTLRREKNVNLEDALVSAIFNGEDLSDIARQPDSGSAVNNLAAKLESPPGLRLSDAMQLIEVRCRLVDDESIRRASLTLAEMINSQRILSLATANASTGTFHFEHVHTLIAHFRWHVNLLQNLTRQAYMLNLASDIPSPNVIEDEFGEDRENAKETDLLSLFTHKIICNLASKAVARFVAFYNFVSNIAAGVGSDSTRAAFKAHAGRCVKRGSLPMTVDMLTMCCTQLKDILSGSAIDLSRMGRLLKSIALQKGEPTAQVNTSAWYLCEPASDAAKSLLASKIVKGDCIVDALRLCSPEERWVSSLAQMAEDEDEKLRSNRSRAVQDYDVLTRAPLEDGKGRFKMCLSCGGKTEIDLMKGTHCRCAANLWWAVQQEVER